VKSVQLSVSVRGINVRVNVRRGNPHVRVLRELRGRIAAKIRESERNGSSSKRYDDCACIVVEQSREKLRRFPPGLTIISFCAFLGNDDGNDRDDDASLGYPFLPRGVSFAALCVAIS